MPNRALLATLIAAGALASAPVLAQAPRPAAPAAPAIAWQRDDWNPVPQPDDLVLPLPCNGAIALRRVVTGPPRAPGKTNQLEDRLVTLGSADDPLKYVGYLRSDFIAGGFFAADGQRYYLIGKYEVTVEQYEAVMGDGSCRPTPTDRAALPASEVSWYDAVEFTHRLNKWLYAGHLDSLPKSSGRPGFARLPSEVEWEFAARGGVAVSDAERANDTFVPTAGNLAEYAWFAGPESSGGQLKSIGSLKPNPLGLYDMLGNVEEIMLEPFQMNRVGRLHGQLGGMVLRGGSYITPRESVRSSSRTEFALYEPNSRDELRLPTFGFRIVVGATALNRGEQAAAIDKEWLDARRTETSVEGKNPLDLLDGLLKQATTPAQKARLEAAIDGLNGEIRKRNELQGRAVKSLLQSAMIIRSSILFKADQFDKLCGIHTNPKVPDEVRKSAKETLETSKPQFELWAGIYADVVQQLGTDFGKEEIKAQADILSADLAARRKGFEQPALDKTAEDVTAYRDNKVRDSKEIFKRVIGTRSCPW